MQSMHRINDPVGREIEIPEDSSENSASFSLDQSAAARAYFEENGYVVLRSLVQAEVCDGLRSAFASTVKKFPGYIYRQTTANPEKNRFNKYGFVMNPILNLQSLSTADFHPLKSLAMATFASEPLKSIGRTMVGEDVKLVQSMYFEGNAETWPHQDTYYLDSERVGTMFACWFALEDINAGAGRFFVVPGSHNIEMNRNGGDVDYAFNHDRYKERVKHLLLDGALEIRAPFLAKGDVLLWNSKTIHGSLRTTRPEFSRASLTAHYIPASHRFLQFQARIKQLKLREYNGMKFHCPKDMEKAVPRAVLQVETRFPRTFQTVKKLAIKALVR
jgi:phytanoyl-CoA hydroxylase